MSSTNKNVRAKTSQMANELWPLVQNEKRANGAPVFADRRDLISHLAYAFHDKRIGGAQSGRNSSIWVDKDATLNYITKYVELAKATKNVAWSASSTKRKVAALKSAPTSSNGKPSKMTNFIIIGSSGKAAPINAPSPEDVMWRVFTESGFRLYQVDGNKLTLTGKLDPQDK